MCTSLADLFHLYMQRLLANNDIALHCAILNVVEVCIHSTKICFSSSQTLKLKMGYKLLGHFVQYPLWLCNDIT